MTCPHCCYPNSPLARRCERCFRRVGQGRDRVIALAIATLMVLVAVAAASSR